MLSIVDKKSLFQDRYQALMIPVPVSGIFRHRHLLKVQALYPEFYAMYKQACERSELGLGDIFVYETQRDLVGIGVGGALSKPKFLVAMAVTEFAENPPHLRFIEQAFVKLEPKLFNLGRYQGIRRVAMLASDELLLPDSKEFETDILPLLEKYLQPVNSLNVTVYR